MANRNTSGFGLISAGTVGSTPATQGQGKYYIDAGDTDDLFQGCTVRMKDGYIVEASSTATFATIGVFNGIFYNASTTLKPTWANWYNQPITPANSEDITCFVIDNPTQLFVGSLDTAAAQAEYGKTYGLTVTAAGSETSGQSSSTLTYSTRHATANQWRLVRSAEDPENNDNATFRSVVVAHNLNQYFTGAVTWA